MLNLKALPKIDLHYHLDGGLRPQTVLDLAKEQKVDLPCDNVEELKKYLSVTDNCTSLIEYLKKFDLPLKCLLTREAQERVAREAVEDAAEQNVKYIEVRFAPQFMITEKTTVPFVVKNVLEGLIEGEKKTGTKARAILCCMRNQDFKKNLEVVNTAIKFFGNGVCGVDLAGDEANYPPKLHKEIFEIAANNGIPITIHAGEAGGAENIKTAVNLLHASRIGHGIRIKEDSEIFEFIKSKKIPLEICVTSNVQTKAAKSLFEHPIKEYLDSGLIVTANTDNITVSNTNMTKEFQILEQNFGFTKDNFKVITLNAAKSAFLNESEKEELIEIIENGYNKC